MERKLASVRKIIDIQPIDGADAIEVARVDGWKVVVKKGEFKIGDLAIYFEIDSWVPDTLASFLSKGAIPKEYKGIPGARLRTIKLRGQVSQGLLLAPKWDDLGGQLFCELEEGMDLTEYLNVQKWEPPVGSDGQTKGSFPSFIFKTDQERVQNIKQKDLDWMSENMTFEVTEKLDGSSMTVYLNEGVFGVCSRNMELVRSEGNKFWKTAIDLDIEGKMRSLAITGDIALQGELIGEGIQGNPYKVKGHKFFIFDIFNIEKQEYFSPEERTMMVNALELESVPLLGVYQKIPNNSETIVAMAEGKSRLNVETEREGVVYKCHGDEWEESFKAISNKFLLKEK